MTLPRNPRLHILLPSHLTTTAAYRAPNAGGRKVVVPPQNRAAHAQQLRANLLSVAQAFSVIRSQQQSAGWENGFGLTVKFSSFPDVQLAIDSLEQKSAGIELLNVREVGQELHASVWIPDGKLALFERKIAEYIAEKKNKNNQAIDNQKLIDAIRDIRTAVIEDLWIDQAPLPAENEIARFEAWMSTPNADDAVGRNARFVPSEERIGRFRESAAQAGFEVADRVLRFPERAVLLLRGTVAQLRSSSHVLGQLAELRRAPETAEFFMHLAPPEQRAWSDELLSRTQFHPPGSLVPYVCILDTGCTQAHDLLAPALDPSDLHVVNSAWGMADEVGHGTEQSGMALWGDLSPVLADSSPVFVNHRLESVKLLPQDHSNIEEHFAYLTAQAMSLPEIYAPLRRRIFSMAITSTVTTLRGRPTAWSSELDALTSDWIGNGEAPRLVIVSAGNAFLQVPSSYPLLNASTSVEDPAQSWNALTVGALTHKVNITEANTDAYSAIATIGGLSPFSSTSNQWAHDSPFKPDVVFEGGNMGSDGVMPSRFDSLSLLTTHHLPAERYLTTSEATSAATALASRFSAQIMSRYPNLWPETVRALTVHSAQWTPELLAQYPGSTKENVEQRLRHCGWGEPDIDRALHSGSDSLTLVVQEKLQPFHRQPKTKVEGKMKGGNVVARDMHLHRLPWPRRALEDLIEHDVELRITLSYYIEPNPGERGRSSRFAYASHGLRFAVQKPDEPEQEFRRRINQLARDAEEGLDPTAGGDTDWVLGFRKRFRGSLHHDRLTCSAVALAARQNIAVFPVGGWWKTREAQERFEREARYSLVASIHAPDIPLEVDLYTGVMQVLQTASAVETAIST